MTTPPYITDGQDLPPDQTYADLAGETASPNGQHAGPDDEVEHGKIVLATVIAHQSYKALGRITTELQAEYFTDPVQRKIFGMIGQYKDQADGILSREAVADMVRSEPAGQAQMYQSYYDLLAARKPTPDQFRWSVLQLRKLACERYTGEALASAMEVLTGGAKDEHGNLLRGHADVWRYLDATRLKLDLDDEPTIASKMRAGGAIMDAPAVPPAIWGEGGEIIWAEGQAMVVYGPDGIGKTTLAACLLKARLGLSETVLGLPVKPCQGKILLLLMDRPTQALTAIRRLFSEEQRKVLDEQVVIWPGPPPADLAADPGMLLQMVKAAGATDVIVDSLKDAALRLSDDATGSGWNRAVQTVTEAGCEVLVLHHPRKAQAENKKPNKIDDLYGNRWLYTGTGSIVCLWGEPGDPIVEFTLLKKPAEDVGPWKVMVCEDGQVLIDHEGTVDLVAIIRRSGPITAMAAARVTFGTENPTNAQAEKMRRLLNRKTDQGIVARVQGTRGGGTDRTMTTWKIPGSGDMSGLVDPGLGSLGERPDDAAGDDAGADDAGRNDAGRPE